MAMKEIHIRLPVELYEKLSQFMQRENLSTNSKAITYILDQFFQLEHAPVLVEQGERENEDNAMIAKQELHIESLKQEISTYKEQMMIKDRQIMGLVAVQGQLSSNVKQLSERIPEKKKHWWNRS